VSVLIVLIMKSERLDNCERDGVKFFERSEPNEFYLNGYNRADCDQVEAECH